MISRRTLVLSGAALMIAASLAMSRAALAQPTHATANDPLAIVNGIYKQVTFGNGDLGGAFMLNSKAKYFSKALIALWAKADAHTPKDEVGPVDFDPATNSQDPVVKSATAAVESKDSGTATVAATLVRGNLAQNPNPADNVLRYDFVRDGGHWKIDDIRGATDGKPWSLRKLLSESLKN